MRPEKNAPDRKYLHSDFLPDEDPVPGSKSEASKGWKTLGLAGLVVLLIAGLATGLGVGLSSRGGNSSASSPPAVSNVPANVQKLCAQTEFSDVCEPALSGLPGASTASDEQLVNMALKATVNLLNSVNGLATSLAGNSKNLQVKQAAESCQELLAESADELNITSIMLEDIISGRVPTDDANATETIGQLVSRVNAASTGNTDCAEAIYQVIEPSNGANVTQDVNLAFQYAANTAMALENAAALIKKLPGFSSAIQTWQDKQRNMLKSGFNATLLDAGAFGPDNDTSGSGGSRRLLSELQVDDKTPAWLRRRLLQKFPRATVTVNNAKGSRDNFKKLQQAINNICENDKRGTILVKPGKYREKVVVPKKCKLTILGIPGKEANTVISWDDNFGIKGIQTFKTATFEGKADDLVLAYLTIENTAGLDGRQAVALRLTGLHQAVYKCKILGNQDTLYVSKGVQYIRDTFISGTVDFIFGNSAAFFDRCTLQCIARSSSGTFNTITAQSRTAASQQTGFVFGSCNIIADGGMNRLIASRPGSYRVYMGRPWKEYSRVVFALSNFGSFLDDKHWVNWDGSTGQLPSTVFYAEFENFGRGYSKGRVIKGARYLTRRELRPFLISNFIDGETWLGKTGIPLN